MLGTAPPGDNSYMSDGRLWPVSDRRIRLPHSLDSEFLAPCHCLKATQARINHAAMNAAPPIGVSTPSQGMPVSASA